MHADPILPRVVAATLVVLLIGLTLRRLRQPHVIGYLLAGVALGPFGLGVFEGSEAFSRLGDMGIVVLLFFVGMEMSLPRLSANWRIAVLGTLLQTSVSVAAVGLLAYLLDWTLGRAVLVGFVISLSSTSVVISLLNSWKELDSELGQDTLGILIVQDVAVAPMLLTIGILSRGTEAGLSGALVPLVGAIAVMTFAAWLVRRESITLPFAKEIERDPELQVFAAAFLCLGFALTTALFELSTALGAFIAGVVVSSSRQTEWVHGALEPFRVLLMALFFVSIGLLVNIDYVVANTGLVLVVVVSLLLTNTIFNGLIVRLFGRPWRHSLLAGALLAQAGDFSFVLAAIGLESGLITEQGYQLVISVIFASLLLSPGWVAPFRWLAGMQPVR